MILTSFFGMFLALSASGLIGASDFCGGLASRRGGELRVTVVTNIAGVSLLIFLSFIWREAMLSWNDVVWCILAGICGALAIIFIYRAFTMGSTAAVAPIAGVIGAALPAIFGMITEGLPVFSQLLGFVVALPGIVLVSMTQTTSIEKAKKEASLLAVLSGVAAAGFFTFLAQVASEAVVLPSLIAKSASLGTALLLVLLRPKQGDEVSFRQISPIAILGGVMDATASALFVFAQQLTRLDVAVVLTSLYPASTIMLAYLIQKEKISHRQWMGVGLCLAAIVLIVV
ncbi:MAG: DMT family transporter [Anaerolineaceae bacterium]|jgi:drug/metabolite transporter (DMT)-like permease|nr:DMT family transporter [Anaerolineaceae bacterium]